MAYRKTYACRLWAFFIWAFWLFVGESIFPKLLWENDTFLDPELVRIEASVERICKEGFNKFNLIDLPKNYKCK